MQDTIPVLPSREFKIPQLSYHTFYPLPPWIYTPYLVKIRLSDVIPFYREINIQEQPPSNTLLVLEKFLHTWEIRFRVILHWDFVLPVFQCPHHQSSQLWIGVMTIQPFIYPNRNYIPFCHCIRSPSIQNMRVIFTPLPTTRTSICNP